MPWLVRATEGYNGDEKSLLPMLSEPCREMHFSHDGISADVNKRTTSQALYKHGICCYEQYKILHTLANLLVCVPTVLCFLLLF